MPWPFRHFLHRHHHNRAHPVLVIDNFAVELLPNEVIHMAFTIVAGQKSALSIAFLDQHGNPMVPTPAPDSPPVWANTTPASETLTVAADGLSAVDTAVAPGTDTINLTVIVGGVTFAATVSVTVSAAPQVLTSVQIVAGAPA